jgi:hypothetical protein
MLARQVAERVACLAREDAEVGYDLSNGRHVHARYQNTADLQTMPCADRSWWLWQEKTHSESQESPDSSFGPEGRSSIPARGRYIFFCSLI